MILAATGFAITFFAYWLAPNRGKEPILITAGVMVLLLSSVPAALGLCALIAAVWFGMKQSGSRALGALALVVAGFAGYKLFASGGPLERSVSLVGFAYAVPRAIHLLVDARYRGLERPSFLTLNAYFWFFPLLVVGPIHRLPEYQRSTRRRRFDPQQIGHGLERVLVGLTSVKILADWLVSVRLHNYIVELPADRSGLASLLRSVEYGLNLYFQFAGWTAVAIGISALFGHDVAENFNRPFAQRNITEFWRSWHMTLTRWTREYVFQPVAAQTRRPYLATFATMLAIALWHEFSGRYVVWALWHASGLVVHRSFQTWLRRGTSQVTIGPRAGHLVGAALTTSFVFLGFTITRVDSVVEAWHEFEAIFTGGYL